MPPPNPDDGTAPRRGRPTKLTPDLALAICQCILEWNHRYVAGQRFGIRKKRFQAWMQSGAKQPGGLYGAFRSLVLESEATAEQEGLSELKRASPADPKIIQWWLERKFPQRWGRDRGRLYELERRMKGVEKTLESGDPATH